MHELMAQAIIDDRRRQASAARQAAHALRRGRPRRTPLRVVLAAALRRNATRRRGRSPRPA